MIVASLNTSKVTSGVQILHVGPCWYHGFIATKYGSQSGATLTVADSSNTAAVGTTILDHCAIVSGVSIAKPVYYNTVCVIGRKCENGLYVACPGFAAGVTVSVFWR